MTPKYETIGNHGFIGILMYAFELISSQTAPRWCPGADRYKNGVEKTLPIRATTPFITIGSKRPPCKDDPSTTSEKKRQRQQKLRSIKLHTPEKTNVNNISWLGKSQPFWWYLPKILPFVFATKKCLSTRLTRPLPSHRYPHEAVRRAPHRPWRSVAEDGYGETKWSGWSRGNGGGNFRKP